MSTICPTEKLHCLAKVSYGLPDIHHFEYGDAVFTTDGMLIWDDKA